MKAHLLTVAADQENRVLNRWACRYWISVLHVELQRVAQIAHRFLATGYHGIIAPLETVECSNWKTRVINRRIDAVSGTAWLPPRLYV